ncbi:hypothetical protein Q9L58_005018 [Maublancomyces gigas]|uniref:CNH domain-containing protein n=1 Tax=Discina gigas TaxID=1032678 RepID=A0ABR3GJ91_9PEZI
MLLDLVTDLPLDTPENDHVEITSLEAWEQNLYVGTSAHEILHFVSIPPTPAPVSSSDPARPVYILASRLQPPATGSGPAAYIKQILLLPTVSRALVLSSTGFLSFYTLPEFSPVSGTKLKDVAYVGGLDLDEEDYERQQGALPADERGKQVIVLTKKLIRIIRVGTAVRQIKPIELPAAAITTVRRNVVACIANAENYALIDTEHVRQIPLFPISTSSGDEPPAIPPPDPPPPMERSHSGSASMGSASMVRSASGSHPQRTSPLTTGNRERRNSSAAMSRENSAGGVHNRSSSTSNIGRGRPGASRTPGRRTPSRLSVPDASSSRPTSPALNSPASPQSASPTTSIPGPSSGSRRASGSSQSTPSGSILASLRARTPTPQPPPPPVNRPLLPHIASPNSSEFLLTTGTRWEDPGVGLFVNVEGDVTRGTISFEKYPEDLLVQGNWVAAIIPNRGIEVQRWNLEDGDADAGADEEEDRRGMLAMTWDGSKLGIKEVITLDGSVVGGVVARLRLERISLAPGETGGASRELERREREEKVIAERVSTVDSRVVVFKGKRIWTLVQSPLALRLDSRLPMLSPDKPEETTKSRILHILKTLHKVDVIEPSTERGFHEVAYIRQKGGLLLLGEFLRLTTFIGTEIEQQEVIIAEEALIESALDPRLVLALFGAGFMQDIVVGEGGIWVYGGVKKVFNDIRSTLPEGEFTRDTLLLLKRYLAVWKRKKGFGSIADEKEIFATVDIALIRALLLLDSPQYLPQKGTTLIPEGNVRAELHTLVEKDVEDFERTAKLLNDFGRLYVLSILLQSRKLYREVLGTWKRLLEEGDTAGEFGDGEERIKKYLVGMKDAALVEEFGKWLAARNPRLGVQVFSDERVKVKFEPAKVLEILKECAPTAVRGYIEHLVEKGNTDYADDLVFLYLEDLTDILDASPSACERLRDSYESYRALTSPKPTYREFIVDNSPPSFETAGQSDWWRDRLRFLELLGGEGSYDIPKVLGRISKFRDVLVPEMVILYGKEARHEDALRLLTHGLKDFDTAINYCLFGGLSIFQTRKIITDREEQKALFAVLLGEFLKLEEYEERLEQTTLLLERFGGWLDLVHVLELIPENWSVEMLSGFLLSALRQMVREKAELGLLGGLRRGENLKVEGEYLDRCDVIGPTVEK